METKSPAPKRRLSPVDAAFLYIERKEIPLHVACVSIFDGPLPFEKFVAAIESKMHLLPRFRQIVVTPALNLGHPTLEPDPHFDIRRHIFRVRVDPPGGRDELEALAGRILSDVMDRSKPLWDISVVEGLAERRCALIVRVHHSMMDGIAGTSFLKSLFDETPEGPFIPPEPKTRSRKVQSAPPSLKESLGDAVRSSLAHLLALDGLLVQFTNALATGRLKENLQQVAGLLPEIAAPVERLPFNRPCTGERKFCVADLDLANALAIRAALGGTVNHVILTVVTRALAHYVKLHGETVVNRFVRVICPVNLRGEEKGESMGNRISFLPVVLPMGERDPARMYRAVAARAEIMKNAGAANLVGAAAACIGAALPPMQNMFWTGLSNVTLPAPLFNIIVTNMPGPPAPLYCLGKRMLTSYPHVPTGYDLGVGIAVWSYAGKLSFGLTADAQAAPDVARLRDFLQVAFEELCQAAEVKPAAQPRRPAPKARKRLKPKRRAPAAEELAVPLPPEPQPREPAPVEPPALEPAPGDDAVPEPAPVVMATASGAER